MQQLPSGPALRRRRQRVMRALPARPVQCRRRQQLHRLPRGLWQLRPRKRQLHRSVAATLRRPASVPLASALAFAGVACNSTSLAWQPPTPYNR